MSETVETEGEFNEGIDIPPELSICVAEDIHVDSKDVNLPVDIFLLTVKDCEYLACYMLLKDPFQCYFDQLGHVLFGEIGEGHGKKLKVALTRYARGFINPEYSLSTVKDAVLLLRPKAVIYVGTCIGLNPEKTKLGDVVVSAKLTTHGSKAIVSSGDEFTDERHHVSRCFLDMVRGAIELWKAPLRDPGARDVKVHCDGEFLRELTGAKLQYDELIKSYPKAIAIEMGGEGKFYSLLPIILHSVLNLLS